MDEGPFSLNGASIQAPCRLGAFCTVGMDVRGSKIGRNPSGWSLLAWLFVKGSCWLTSFPVVSH